MSILDTVPQDPSPLVITLDFSQFQDGAKYSTLLRQYFERFKGDLNLTDGAYDEYIGSQLLIRMTDVIESDARDESIQAFLATQQVSNAKKDDLEELKKIRLVKL